MSFNQHELILNIREMVKIRYIEVQSVSKRMEENAIFLLVMV